MNFEKITLEDAKCLTDYFKQDLPYYIAGLDAMKDILDTDDENLYMKKLKDHHLSIHTNREDLELKYKNTKHLVDIFTIIIEEVDNHES